MGRNILLVEPDYRSKFPPLGLMRLSTYHNQMGDLVTFVRGKDPEARLKRWHRVYVSSLFTFELKRTVETARYYSACVPSIKDVFIGGVGATLLPDYIRKRVPGCTIVEGPIDQDNRLEAGSPSLHLVVPNYRMLEAVSYRYVPDDAYFCRTTVGCIRKCPFCAVPTLEPRFYYAKSIRNQISEVKNLYGEKRDLVLLDNNVLASERFPVIAQEIRDEGFHRGARFVGVLRTVDFNQGIDARLIDDKVAGLLSEICLSPVRLALDYDAMIEPYQMAVRHLAKKGFDTFTTYVMYNFQDTPESFYKRLRCSVELSKELNVRITSFPMRYIPINEPARGYVGKRWKWRFLRGIQCILHASKGLVWPTSGFFEKAFGKDAEEFIRIVSMPDRYIIERDRHESEVDAWASEYGRLDAVARNEFLDLLSQLHKGTSRRSLADTSRFAPLLKHYYTDDIGEDQLRLTDIVEEIP